MEDKERYLQAMRKNQGKLDDISLGEMLGLDEDATRKIISELLAEFKIDYEPDGCSDYKVKKIEINNK